MLSNTQIEARGTPQTMRVSRGRSMLAAILVVGLLFAFRLLLSSTHAEEPLRIGTRIYDVGSPGYSVRVDETGMIYVAREALLKTMPYGDTLWNSSEGGRAVDVYPSGYSFVAGDNGSNSVLTSIDTSGIQIWSVVFGTNTFDDAAEAVAVGQKSQVAAWPSGLVLKGWSYRKPISIANSSGGPLTNHQVKVYVDTQTPVAAGNMNADGSDIRFAHSDSETTLAYWIESGMNSTNTRIWVKTDVLSTGSSAIHLYYGNTNATATSDADATFLFFDDFTGSVIDTSKWVNVGAIISADNAELTQGDYIKTIDSFDQADKIVAEYRLYKYTDKEGDYSTMGFASGHGDTTPAYFHWYNHWPAGSRFIYVRSDKGETGGWVDTGVNIQGQWNDFAQFYSSTKNILSINDGAWTFTKTGSASGAERFGVYAPDATDVKVNRVTIRKWAEPEPVATVQSTVETNAVGVYVAGWSGYAEGTNMYMAKFDHDGVLRWLRYDGDGATGSVFHGHGTFATDTSVAYAVGHAKYSSIYNNQTNQGGEDAYIVCYDKDGLSIWSRVWGSAQDEQALAVCADSDGNIYVAGFTAGDFDGETNTGGYDLFLSKYSDDGTRQWSRIWGSPSNDYGVGVAAWGTDTVYVVGVTEGEINGEINSGGRDLYLTVFSADGSRVWNQTWGSTADDEACSVAVHSRGMLHVTGSAKGPFDGQSHSGGDKMFLCTFVPPSLDTDYDGMPDWWEWRYGLDPVLSSAGADADGDGLLDGEEYSVLSDPTLVDTDGDGIPDKWEFDYGTDPTNFSAYADPDLDGMNNLFEYTLGLSPNTNDFDGDGLLDGEEYFVLGTDPNSTDSDGDGMPDAWEVLYNLNPTMDDASQDHDLDWLTNLEEYQNALNPEADDTNADGTNDHKHLTGKSGARYTYDRLDRLIGVEYERGRSIAYTYDGNGNLLRQLYLDRDEDGDGLLDLWEFLNGLSWTNGTGTQGMLGDPDGDGWSNYQELMGQSSPTSGTSTPDVYGPAGSTAAVFQVAFMPDNFVMAVGQLDGMLGEEVIVGADGNPGGTNSLLILTEQASGWTTETVPIGEYGFTSISIGQPTNATQAAIYVGLRSGTGTGAVMQVKQTGGTWEKTLIASSTSEVAYVVGVRNGNDVVVSLDTTNNPSQSLIGLTPSTTNWTVSVLDTNSSHRGLGLLVSTNEASAASTVARLLDAGDIQVKGSSAATIQEPTVTSRLLWRGKAIASGRIRDEGSQHSLLHAVINDTDSSGLANEGDEFVLAEYRPGGGAWTTQTLSRAVLERGPSYAKPYALAAVDFTNGTEEIVFTGEPDGSVYSWQPQGGTGALERALFTSRYQGKTWHQFDSHAGLQAGEGLVGLQVDPSSPGKCRVIYWRPERSVWTPASVLQTAPITRIMADPNRGGGYAAVDVKLWDAEGNAALPVLQYEDPVSSNWVDASVALIDGLTYSYAMTVQAMPTGSLHQLLWNAGSDLGLDFTNAVHLRARSADMSAWGQWSDPVLYRIDATTDSDRDGLPDTWELTYGLNLLSASGDDGAAADLDGDTFCNLQEYIADTNPWDIESLLIITGVHADGALLRVDWKGGQQAWQYLRYRPNLTDTGLQWSAIFTNTPPTETTNSLWIDMGTNRTGMFRIEAER